MRYVKFGSQYLVQQEVKSQTTVEKVVHQKTNHIWIYDRSWSMSYELPNMINQLVNLSRELPKGDTLTLGYFSSEGEYNFIIKGFKVADDSDYTVLENAIRNNATPIGCTCFSEILGETETVIKDLSVISNVFSLAFFTDGYPVVHDYRKEHTNIFANIEKIKGDLTTAMFIGYGHYYNKPLMTEMAEQSNGMLIHNDSIADFTPTITKLVKLSESAEPRIEVDALVNEPVVAYTVTSQGVSLLSVIDGKVSVAPQGGDSVYVYYVSDIPPCGEEVDVDTLDFAGDDELCKGIYGGAFTLCQKMNTDKAMELMGIAGDVNLIDKLTNAFTIDEFGATERIIDEAINDSSVRFSNGKDTNYLPKADAFCVLDILNVLLEDEDSAFFPFDDRFKYEKISKTAVSEDNYGKFTGNKDNACSFDSLTWNKSRLNLSVKTTIKGKVVLQERDGKTAQDFGFNEEYPTWQHKNYSAVKDGRANMGVVYITSSKDTYTKLKNEGVVVEDTFKKKKVYGVNLKAVPVMNRAMADGNTSGTELCRSSYRELELQARIKVLKALLPEEEFAPTTFSEEQKQFLIENGINVDKGGNYSPPAKAGVPAQDFYMANRFEIKIAKCSSLPTVKKVTDKLDTKISKDPTAYKALGKDNDDMVAWVNANFTKTEALMVPTVQEYRKKRKTKVEWLNKELGKAKAELVPVRKKIQETKFAIILGRKWFDEFTDRSQTKLDVDGNSFTFKLDEEKVKI